MNPEGKAALINGGARIGREVAAALARRGCDLLLTYRSSREAAEATAERAMAAGVRAATIRADAGNEEDVRAAVEEAGKRFGRLDIVVNMASTYDRIPLDQVDAANWAETIGSNASGALLFSLAAAPMMRRAGAGRIVNFTDWLPVSGRPRYSGYTPYYAAKSAVIGLTQSLALEMAPEILVNAIAPGPIVPPAGSTPEREAKVVSVTPLRRWGGGEEIAKAVLFLIETDFVTGECIRVDGGRHLY